LFQHLQDFRWIAFPGFADEKMDVFRHHDVANQLRGVPGTHFVKDSHEAIARAPRSKKRAAPVAAESDEVEITSSEITPQRVAHGRTTRTLKTEGCGTHIFYL